ncbi:MAG: hypothetical protein LIP01_00140, partial [Tannerellaceae bacterium]|nr:hypothetical protein [Tannerellaceae bacterium]
YNSLPKVYKPKTSPVAEQIQGRAITENSRYSSLLFESYITFDKTFAGMHHLNVIGGYSWQEFDSYVESTKVEGFVTDNLGADNLAGGINPTPTNNQEKTVLSLSSDV